MKNTYVKPLATVEGFVANEYVTACWGVACAYGIQGGFWGHTPSEGGGRHRKITEGGVNKCCGWESNQYIIETATGFKMTEVKTDGLGDLECTVTEYVDNDNNGMPDDGTTIKWTTAAGGTTYYHKGTVNYSDRSRPNHS